MKNLRNFIMAFVGFIAVAMCVTSCLSNEDDSLDYTTQKRYQQIISGQKLGKIRFYRQSGTRAYAGQQTLVKYDSLENASWYVGADSTITINNFPVYMLDSAIIVNKDATGDDAVKYRSLNQAIRALKNSSLGSENVKAIYAIPSTGWVSESVIQFMFQPTTIKRTINFNGADHEVYFVFNSYNIGACSTSNLQFQASFSLSAICIDKLSQQNAVPSTYFNSVGILLAK